MKEIFVIYNKDTGLIEGGFGKIDREWDVANADGSTILERIPEILAKYPNQEVVFLPLQDLPDPTKVKIENEILVPLTVSEDEAIKLELERQKKIENEMGLLRRAGAIQSLIDKGELPADYK